MITTVIALKLLQIGIAKFLRLQPNLLTDRPTTIAELNLLTGGKLVHPKSLDQPATPALVEVPTQLHRVAGRITADVRENAPVIQERYP